MFSLILLGFLFLAALVYIIKFTRHDKNSPPGPPRLPLIGNLHQMAKADPFGYRAFHKMSQEYGEIMSVKVGLQEMVVLSSYKVMKDLLSKEELSGRLWTGFLVDRSMGQNLGIAFASGENQRIMKTFVISTLKEFGFGKSSSMESIVQTELEQFMNDLKRQIHANDGTVLMERFFQLSLLNVLWSMMAGIRYDHDNPKLKKLLKINSEWFQSGNFGAGIVTAYPFLRFLFPEWTGYNQQKKGNKAVHGFLRDLVEEHRRTEKYKEDPSCFIDVFLSEICKNGGTNNYFTEEQFIVVCYDMFQAGFETTSNTLAFGFLFMALNPRVQYKVQTELDSMFPGKNSPLLADREMLIYTRATMFEVFRLSNILPISGPRLAMNDIKYKNFKIKKGTAITFNTYSVMRSTEIWGEDADIFRPERFIDPLTGQLNGLKEYIPILFGQGERSCMGQILAQTTVWMYFTTLLQNFTFETCTKDDKLPTVEPIFGIILSPQPYYLNVKIRE